MTYVVYGVVPRVDRVPARCAPFVRRFPVDQRVATLEVIRKLEKRVVLALDERPRDLLLQNLAAPVILEPRLLDLLLMCVGE